MCENCIQDACHPMVITSQKLRGFRGIMSTGTSAFSKYFAFTFCLSLPFFTIIKFVLNGFFSGFTNHQQLLRSLVQVKNVLASKIKFTRRYWLIKKEKWKMCNRVIFTHLYMSLFLSICPSILPSVAHCIRNCTSSDYNFWYTCVKWWHLQACFFFSFSLNFDFSGC